MHSVPVDLYRAGVLRACTVAADHAGQYRALGDETSARAVEVLAALLRTEMESERVREMLR